MKRQKEVQKEQVYIIPTIKVSASHKNRIAQKEIVPNVKYIANKSVHEEKMRAFLVNVKKLTDDDFIIPDGGYPLVKTINMIVTGYRFFVSNSIQELINSGYEENITDSMREDITKERIDLPLFFKKLWVIKGYGYD